MAHEALQDISLVRSCLTEEEAFEWRGATTAEESSNLEAALQSAVQGSEEASEAVHRLAESAVTVMSFSVSLCSAPPVLLLVDYPLGSAQVPSTSYSAAPASGLTVGIAAPELDEKRKRHIDELLQERLAQITDEGEELASAPTSAHTFAAYATLDGALAIDSQEISNPVFDIYSMLSEHISSTALRGEGNEQASAPREGNLQTVEDGTATSRQVKMRRDIFWTHHLLAPSKRRDFNAWSSELDVWILVKIGYPGFLIFEGLTEGVEELCRRVKGLQWAALSHRSTVEYQHDGAASRADADASRDALLACKLASGHASRKDARVSGNKFRTGYEELESTGEVVARLKESCFTEEEIVGGLSLRVSSAPPKDKG